MIDDYVLLSFDKSEGQIKSFSTASRAKSTLVKVEIEFTDAYAMSRFVERLHEAKMPPKRERWKPEPIVTPPPERRAALEAPRLALPAPKGARHD